MSAAFVKRTLPMTQAEKHAAAERELALRLRVYPKWVKDGRLTEEKADLEIFAMEQIRDDYAAPPGEVRRRELKLVEAAHRVAQNHRDWLKAVPPHRGPLFDAYSAAVNDLVALAVEL